MRRSSVLALMALVWASSSLAEAQPSAYLFPSPPRLERLDNGLVVVSVPWESPGIISYHTLVRVGSRDEVEPGHSGFAHLFEHMMFRGTPTLPAEAYERRMQGFGADHNAFTTQDYTLYTFTGPSEVLSEVVEIEADRFRNLAYDETTFRTETGAVRGEYDASASDPSRRMWEALSELAFTRHTYGHTTLGYLRDIDAMPTRYAYSRRFFRRFYTPDNCVIFVVGDVDHDALMRQVRLRYGGWRGRRDQPRVPTEGEPSEGGRRHLDWPARAAPRVLLGYRTPAFAGSSGRPAERRAAISESAALEVARGLAFDRAGPLHQRLVVLERRLTRLESWDHMLRRDPHLMVVDASLREPERVADAAEALDAAIEAIQAELDRIGRGETDPTRVEAVRSHLRYSLASEVETPAQVAELLARFYAAGGGLEALDAYLEALAALTPADVARVASRYLVPSRRFVVTLAHGEAPEGE